MQRAEDAIVHQLPKPIARSFAQAIGRVDGYQRARDLLATFEAALQYLAFTGIARAAPETLQRPSLREALARVLPRPTLGGLVTLLRELDAAMGAGSLAGVALDARRDDLPALAALVARRARGAPQQRTSLLRAFGALVEFRNDEAHRRVGSQELASDASLLHDAVAELLLALPALRLELVHAERVSRQRDSLAVFFRIFRGAGPALPLRDVPALPRDADIVEGAVYLRDPHTGRFDELSPWLLVAGDDVVGFSGIDTDGRPTYVCAYARVDARELGAATTLLRERAPFLFAAVPGPAPPSLPVPSDGAPPARVPAVVATRSLRVGVLFESGEALGAVIERFARRELPEVEVSVVVHGPDHYERARDEFLVGDYDVVLLDDIWIPAFAAAGALAPLDAFLDARADLSSAFIGDLLRWGRARCADDPEGSERQVAIPLMGNVLMALYRSDLVDGTPTFPYSELSRAALERPIGVRFDTRNNVVETFIEVMRALGAPERMGAGPDAALELPAAGVSGALAWLRAVAAGPIDRFRSSADLEADLAAGDSALLLGWPAWIREAQLAAAGTVERVRVARVSPTPVLGAWYLAVRRSSALVETAANLAMGLATRVAWQEAIAAEMMVPVIDTLEPAALRRHAFWRQNWTAVRDALRRARPRPRTPRWDAIERALGDAILEALESPEADATLVAREGLFAVIA